MFEDCLVESAGVPASATKRWTAGAVTVFECAVLAVMVVLPLTHPERLMVKVSAPQVFVPKIQRPVVHVETRAAEAVRAVNYAEVNAAPLTAPGRDRIVHEAVEQEPVIANFGNGLGRETGFSAVVGDSVEAPHVSVAPETKAKGRLRVSDGVTAGVLLTPIRPVYPAIARATRKEGTVVVEAVISRQGTIESLRVTSGPEILREAALDAIRAARYQPYRLNGEAVEIQTTITVKFKMTS
jgi:protein TonB